MKLGKRVLGEKVWREQQKAEEVARARGYAFGHRVTGAPKPSSAAPPNAEAVPKGKVAAKGQEAQKVRASEASSDKGPTAPAAPKQNGPKHVLSVTEIQKALTSNPSVALLDELIAAEFERAEGQPRKGALRLLLRAEQARGKEARKPIVAELTAALDK